MLDLLWFDGGGLCGMASSPQPLNNKKKNKSKQNIWSTIKAVHGTKYTNAYAKAVYASVALTLPPYPL
jgi:hypothetical protein